jgi:hypothetical protein
MNTFNLAEVNNATDMLIGQNAEYLINYIYEHQKIEPYVNPVIRIGLALKILLKSNKEFTITTLSPTIDDLTLLINSSPDSELRKTYIDELKYVQSCTLNDDLISLNTTKNGI